MMTMRAAIVGATIVTLSVPLFVMIAFCQGIEGKGSGKVSLHRFIRISQNTAENFDTGSEQCHSCSAADSPANENLNAKLLEHLCQGSVSAPLGINHLGMNNLSIFCFIDFKGLGVSKMLEHHSSFIGYCNFHYFSLLFAQFFRIILPYFQI